MIYYYLRWELSIFSAEYFSFSGLRILICNHFSAGVQRNQQDLEHWLNMNIYSSPCCADPYKHRAKTDAQNIYSMYTRVVFHTGIEAQSVCCGVRIPARAHTC
jgi:hypothetical protein